MQATMVAAAVLLILVLMYLYPPTQKWTKQAAPWVALLGVGLALGYVVAPMVGHGPQGSPYAPEIQGGGEAHKKGGIHGLIDVSSMVVSSS